ncbi:MAG: thermonuclease family protein, partial [Candidatus Cloacimonadales bacterium]|nr:thermonuclease family protein [Candidatus Cloacimonadales bacterium]
MKDLRLITMLFILFAFANLFSYDIVGKVIAVKDGDTIEVLQGKETYRIRLFGIDCPEKNQAFGNKAKQFTSDKCYGKKVTVRVNNKDMYGRYVADVILPNRDNLNVL